MLEKRVHEKVYSRNKKYALLLLIGVTATSISALSEAFAQQVGDGMDGYVKGTSGIYTGNTHECWYDGGDGKCCHVKSILVIPRGYWLQHH